MAAESSKIQIHPKKSKSDNTFPRFLKKEILSLSFLYNESSHINQEHFLRRVRLHENREGRPIGSCFKHL